MSSAGSMLPSAARGILSSCRNPLRNASIAPVLSPFQQVRGLKNKPKKGKEQPTKSRKGPQEFRQKNLKDMPQYALCDAMRLLSADISGPSKSVANPPFENTNCTSDCGRSATVPLSVTCSDSLTPSRQNPASVSSAPPGSKAAKEALAAGAVLVGEDEVFDAVKAGTIEFDRCLAHPDSLPALNKAALGRILGPRGLMPSAKTGTVVEDVASRVQDLRGGTVYRERDAVIRLPVGQLGFSPEQLRDNMRVTLDQIKKDASALTDRVNKEIYEVVLSSTNGPGFSLNGEFRSDASPPTSALTGV
ncbi:hypothetical protein N7489_001758 [Penicillium chrysogenum]|uniref:uncharacterized protein n=1 Tax=Penicillium chrysogenum TaxID=5076 RepID=UPI0023A266EB|nr:uncharacterized protein N7489_001758 [Penicillium chrysogenum]KAJ5251348.1 hypothetical protein N7489_001758 [Penicillium chrysogenum]KAJ5262781.1 hypothetical protein N7524_008086 [Penicillium chrysogenum]KAJ6147008.1 hypothetical protein N7497_008990 [Penicillium chrysogenum]